MEKKSRKDLAIVGTTGEPDGAGVPLPKTLGSAGRSLWRSIQAEYNIADSGGLALLTSLCEATDRAAELRVAIERDGAVITTRSGPRVHPAVKEELGIRAFITRALSKLGVLDEPLHGGPGRPSQGGIGWKGFHDNE